MKKSLIIFLVCFALVLAFGIWFFADINKTADMVDVQEIVRVGDIAAAEGLSITVRTNLDDHLFWETPFRAGEPGLRHSVFRSSVKPDYGEGEWGHSGIYLSGSQYNPGPRVVEEYGDKLTGIGKAYYELYMSLAPGAEAGTSVYLKDYIDYYPIDGSIDLPGLSMNMNDPVSEWNNEENNESAWQLLNDYFRIPVLEDEMTYISMRKDDKGNINGIGGGSGGADNFNFRTESVIFPDAVYFTINNRSSNDGELVDTSLIPGGYGIYRLPYSLNNGVYFVDFDGLSTVKPLDEAFRVYWIIPDDRKENMILIGAIEDELWLYVIDEKTMETEQELLLDKGDIAGAWQYIDGGDYIVFALEGERLALVERDEMGEYILRFKVNNSIAGELYDIYRVQDTAWDGSRLALGGFKAMLDINEYYSGDFYYAVFDETGLRCFADCDSSLCLNADDQWRGVRGNYYDSMSILWE